MKKIHADKLIAETVLAIFALSLLLTACSKSKVPSDAEIRQKIQGVWKPDFNTDFTWKIEADGHFTKLYDFEGTNMWTEDGNWSVTNRLLALTMTNHYWPNYVVPDEHYTVVQIDDHELLFISGDVLGKARKALMTNTPIDAANTNASHF
jgi:hypothetical protein